PLGDQAAPCNLKPALRAEKRRDHTEHCGGGQEGIFRFAAEKMRFLVPRLPQGQNKNENSTRMLQIAAKFHSRLRPGWFIILSGLRHRVMPRGVPIMPALRILVLLVGVLILAVGTRTAAQVKKEEVPAKKVEKTEAKKPEAKE